MSGAQDSGPAAASAAAASAADAAGAVRQDTPARAGTATDAPAHSAHATAPPAMSVVICVDRQRLRGARALRSVLAQDAADRLEVILQDVGHADFPPLDASGDPRVRCIPLPRGLSYGEAMTRGALAARAPIVTFLEEHAVALPGWAAALIAAHADIGRGAPCAAVGPELHLDNPGRGASDLIDLFAVGPWMAPAIGGDANVLRWQNTSYKRAVLLSYGDRLPSFLDSEGTFFTQLRADGHRLWVEPAARLRHASEHHFLLFARGAFVSNRLGAARRAELLGFSPAKRLLCVASTLVNIARAPGYILRNLSRSPALAEKRRRAARAWPYLVAYSCAFCLGACTGFLLGRGRSGQQFLEYELNATRDIRGYEQLPTA